MIILFIFTFNLLKRFRVAFSFMCDGKDAFIHFFAAYERGVCSSRKAPPICKPSKK